MEGLLQNLQEQQFQLQNFYIDGLSNMERFNDREPPLPPPRKYVSIFRIEGEPILPPLMTTEKRRQMQKLKEKALRIEQCIRDRKQRLNCENDQSYDDITSETTRSSLQNISGNNSQRSQDYYESKLKETQESMILLQNLIKRQQTESDEHPVETVNIACNTSKYFPARKNQGKLHKLQKSEILIYDNSTNKVIQVPAEKDDSGARKQLMERECKANLCSDRPKTPSHLLLSGINLKGMTTIPSICLNPPTPLAANRNLCDTLSTAESSESLIIAENAEQNLDLRDVSSDESYTSMITQTDIRSRNKRQNFSKSPCIGSNAKTPLTPVKNVSTKIQQFEAISSDSNSPPTSPEKLCKQRKSTLGTSVGSMSRSATSPSIKLPNSTRSSSSRPQNLAPDSDNSPENTLVRSSSFTLEGPSKALIDHMQQQKANMDGKTANKSPTHVIVKKPISSPLRAHRDTVESKAKKVQKVELNSSKLKLQQKNSQSKLTHAAAVSISPYNTTALTQHTNNFNKTKRSPYDNAKTSNTYLQSLRKSNSTSSNLSQSRTAKSRIATSASTHTTHCSAVRSPQMVKESCTQIELAQKEKFLRLLAQQDEEHRRLQQSFETQQKMLIEQLNHEMAVAQLKSSQNSYNLSSTTLGLRSKHFNQSTMSAQPQNQLNLTQISSKPPTPSHGLNKEHKFQPSSSSISKNSSYITFVKNFSQTSNAQPSPFASNLIQSSQANTPNNSQNFSSLDQSNASTSLDISTLSTQTSPDTEYAIPTTQNNSKLTTSLSRRRLFSTKVTDVGDALSSRSNNRSPCMSSHQQQQQLNQSSICPKALESKESSKCPSTENSLTLHAAATKINAFVRGFLVRRLFQTEQIQRIVQTIRDTLIFVLNLHMETMENLEESQTPANIKLKARLLQQLLSACRTLHLVFFQTSIKERMEIIARDRKRIKTKLMTVNRKRIAG